MRLLRETINRLHGDERGHVTIGIPSLAGAIGAIMLGYGAAGNDDFVTILGGFVLGVAIFVGGTIRHRMFDADVWVRLDKLEKK